MHHCRQHKLGCHGLISQHCGSSREYYSAPSAAYYIPCCPICYQPFHSCMCKEENALLTLPREAVADAVVSVQDVLIAGLGKTRFTLDYLAIDAPLSPPPRVRVSVASPGGITSTWEDHSLVVGEYYIRMDLPKADPGSKVILEANDAIARLRWYEINER